MIATVIALSLVAQEPDAKAYHQKMLDFGKSAKSLTGEIEVAINGQKTVYTLAFMKPNFLKLKSDEVSYLCDGKTLRTEVTGVSCQDFEAPKDKIEAPFLWGLEGATNAPTILKLVPTVTKSTKDGKPLIVLKYRLPDVKGEQGSVSDRTLEVTIAEATGKPSQWVVRFDGGEIAGTYKKLETDKALKPEDFKLGTAVRRANVVIDNKGD
jgi:hypothetical protein